MGLRIGCESALVQAREQQRSTEGLSQPSHIVPVEFHRSTRAGKSGLTGRNLVLAKLDRRSPWYGHGPGWNVPSAMGNLEADSVRSLVSFRLVDLDQGGFLSLIGDRLSRA